MRYGVRATLLAIALMALPAVASAHGGGGHDDGLHSLRAPVTDESFYFVMADRFENGSTAQRPRRPAGRPAGVRASTRRRRASTTAATWPGSAQRLDYIKGLGTTSIWLTPSFKNKAVQLEDGPSAGYHGYWITDFTQIDPHLGTNDDLRALIARRTRVGMKVFFDIITNHTADVIDYEEGARHAYVSKDRRALPDRSAARRSTTATTPARSSFPPLEPERLASRTRRCSTRPSEHLKVPELAQRRHAVPQPRRHDVRRRELARTATSSGSTTCSPRTPAWCGGMIDIYETWIRRLRRSTASASTR